MRECTRMALLAHDNSRRSHPLYPVGVHRGGNVPIYSAGDRVSQSQYGDGTVTAANEYHTVIDFDTHGSRTFATPRVQLEPSSTAAPVKPAPRRRSAKRN